jgi:hypothetical protein
MHQVDVRRQCKVDGRAFANDFFDLGANGCVSLFDDTIALTSVS